MLSKEEYERNLIRMWDTLRSNHKGEANCKGIKCIDCPLYNKACGSFYVFEAIKIVEQWGKENKIVTNADKFKEMFGIDIETQACVNPKGTCSDCKYAYEDDCYVSDRFWYAEYVEPRKGGDE